MVSTNINGTNTYYFQRNLFGDVVAIYDTNGAKVVEYVYDAWGNCTIKGTTTNYVVAHANPIRYRGYYYDEDTKLYYLNARYYSPEFRRFISPDDTAYLNPESVNGLNLYIYANNNPIETLCGNNGLSKISIYRPINKNKIHTSAIKNSGISSSFINRKGFSVGLVTPNKYAMPSWMSVSSLYAQGTIGWGYTIGDGYSLASFSAGILDATFYTPKWFSSLPDDHLANPNIYLGIGTWNVNASIGIGVSGTAEIIFGTIGIQFGDAISIEVKGYVGIGFSRDFTNGIKFGIGWGLGYEISINIDWYELFH